MKIPILSLLALSFSALAQVPAPSASAQTLKEVIDRFGKYLDRVDVQINGVYAINIDIDANGNKTWDFTCESVRWSDSTEKDGDSGENGTAFRKLVEKVTFRVDSSGDFREQLREPMEGIPLPDFWYPGVFNYCEAVGIPIDDLSAITTDAETNLVLKVGTNAPVHVSSEEIASTEKAHFFATIAGADRIVVRDGGFDCCASVEDIDKQGTFAVITDAAEISAFTSMIQFMDGPSGGQCLCCGYPGIDWWRDGKRVALTSVQHGKALRWRAFSFDYPFTEKSSKALVQWLEAHGCCSDNPFKPRRTQPSADDVEDPFRDGSW